MKKLTLIIHTHAQQALDDLLRMIDQAPGFNFRHVEGQGIYWVTAAEKEGHFL